MKNLNELNKYRDQSPEVLRFYGWFGDANSGVFLIPSPYNKWPLRVIASNGEGWDHISVSKEKRPPTWMEMEYIKRLFFKPDEVAMQLHVKPTDHINLASNCLHIWRPHDQVIPLPPTAMV